MFSTISSILALIMPVLGRIIPDPHKQAEAQIELTKVLTEQQGKIYDSMKEVMVADSQSDSNFTKNARPTIVYWSLGMVTLIVVLAPLGYDAVILASLTKVPGELWNLMTYGIGAYVLGRSVEKSVSNFKK